MRIEDASVLQSPCYTSFGFYSLLYVTFLSTSTCFIMSMFSSRQWFISFIWPVQLYQVILCIALGAAQDYYPDFSYLESVKRRVMTLNAWWLPNFPGSYLKISYAFCVNFNLI